MMKSKDHIELNDQFLAHNYAPLDVVLAQGKGAWVTDVEGKRYLDMLSAYSAVTFGHCNPRLAQAAVRQLDRLTLTGRAFYNDQTGPLAKELAELCGMESVLFMNSGAEAVETALKLARKWGYEIKKVPQGQAEIIVFNGNFHGRTTTIISASDSDASRAGFGPYTPGFVFCPYGDIDALKSAINSSTVGVLIEPIQGEGGVIIPPDGFLRHVRDLCSKNNVLMLADEIQTGLCRTGKLFACDHEQVRPDVFILGKALGGAIVPISAVVSNQSLMSVFTPGTHGSTFGANPFACAIAREVLALIREEHPEQRAQELGKYLLEKLKSIRSEKIAEVRGRGLFCGVDIKKQYGKAKEFCHHLKDLGVLAKDTRDQTIRFAPPVVIEKSEIDWAVEQFQKTLQ